MNAKGFSGFLAFKFFSLALERYLSLRLRSVSRNVLQRSLRSHLQGVVLTKGTNYFGDFRGVFSFRDAKRLPNMGLIEGHLIHTML